MYIYFIWLYNRSEIFTHQKIFLFLHFKGPYLIVCKIKFTYSIQNTFMSTNEGEKELRLKTCKQNEMFGATNRKWLENISS